eukprot:10079566-Lingulodinium_polyedra.AAC.1
MRRARMRSASAFSTADAGSVVASPRPLERKTNGRRGTRWQSAEEPRWTQPRSPLPAHTEHLFKICLHLS